MNQMVADILKRESVSCRRLGRSLGVHPTTVHYWKHGQNPSPLAKIILKLIHRHGLNAVLSGDLTQSVENQGKDKTLPTNDTCSTVGTSESGAS
jgi:hypothetical protein